MTPHRRIAVRRTVAAPPDTVWDALADLASHVEWMADARAIRFTSTQHEGVGTTFDCDTKVGPIRLRDRMEVTEWDHERAMAVRHVGLVTGEGRFTLHGTRRGTELAWEETLRFPWWLPARPAAIVLKLIWRANLRRFERNLGVRAARGARRRVRLRRRAS